MALRRSPPTGGRIQLLVLRMIIIVQMVQTRSVASLSSTNYSMIPSNLSTTTNYRPSIYCSDTTSNTYNSYDLIQVRRNDNYDGTIWSMPWKEAWNTTQYTLNIPIACSSPIDALFYPIMILLPPDDDILCNPNLPIETIEEYQNYEQYYYYDPIAIVLPSLVDRNNSNSNTTTNCTVDVIMNNIITIKAYSSLIMYVFIPESYYSSSSSNSSRNVTKTDEWNYVFDPSTVDDGCIYSDNISFSGAIIIDDTISNGITKDIIKFRKKFGGNPRYSPTAPTTTMNDISSLWWFRMILMTDYNCDEQVTWDDYESFIGFTDYSGGSYPPIGYGGTEEKSSAKSALLWLLPVFGSFFIGYCCWWYAAHEKSQREQQNPTTTTTNTRTNHQGRWQESLSVTTTGAVAGDRQNGQQQQQPKKKAIITKDDFALLPQIIYRCNKRQQSQQRIVVPITSITNTTTKTTSTGKLDIISESVDTPPLQDGIVENNNTITTTTTTIDGGVTSINAISSDTIDNNNNIVDGTNKSLSHRSINESSRSIIQNECCSICLDEFQENETLIALPRCIHFFHPHCIEEWLLIRKSDSCPLCKTIILDQSTITTTITTSEA